MGPIFTISSASSSKKENSAGHGLLRIVMDEISPRQMFLGHSVKSKSILQSKNP